MPTYIYQCEPEGKTFEVYQERSEEALTVCPECKGKCYKRYDSILYGTNSTTTAGLNPGGSAKMEAQIEKDRPAYKAMKEQGLRPGKMIGAHKLMTEARTSFEIESGKLMPQYTVAQIEAGTREAESALGHKLKEAKPRIVGPN